MSTWQRKLKDHWVTWGAITLVGAAIIYFLVAHVLGNLDWMKYRVF